MQVVGRPWVFWSHVLLRFLQFAFSLIALITLSAAFVYSSFAGYRYGNMLGSSTSTYVTIVTYTAMVFALWFLIVIFILRMCGRPPLFYEKLMDFVLAVMLLVAAIVLVCSDYVAHCSAYGSMLRCNSIKTSVVFTFLAFASFLMTLLLSFCEHDKRDAVDEDETRRTADVEHGSEGPAAAPYHSGSTPTARGNPPHSSSRV
jgi:magnesium-transporting ATPase (P-type)